MLSIIIVQSRECYGKILPPLPPHTAFEEKAQVVLLQSNHLVIAYGGYHAHVERQHGQMM